MSTKNNDANKKMLLSTINEYDTIKDFMEKCNSNFLKISQNGGGPAGVQGEEGSQGAPTKPKVPIHVWKKGNEEDGCQYKNEITTQNGFEINEWYEDLSNSIYQNGHLIILENGHVYILKIDETDNFTLKPNYIISLQSYNKGDIIDGKSAYIHIAFANSSDGSKDFTLSEKLNSNGDDEKYYTHMGIYSDCTENPLTEPEVYTWVRIVGDTGEKGEKGEKGDTPTSTSVEVIGYSSSDLDIESNDWKPSISELGELEPGSNIYIKNKYTWSDGSITYGKTVTMAGTQGIKGETGRVLFYLGSFSDGTLKEEPVKGLLNEDRCDYYIDANDQAWMRTGTKAEAEGFKNVEGGKQNNTNYWTKSKKIGFLQAGAISADMINANTFIGSEVIANAVNAAEINADNIKSGKISSTDGKSWFDLDNSEFVLGYNGNNGALSYIDGKLHIGGSQNIGGQNLLSTTSYKHFYNAGDTVYFTELMKIEPGKKYIATYGKFENNANGTTNEVFNEVCLAIGQSGALENIEKVVKFGEPFDANNNGRYLYIAWAISDYVDDTKGTSPNIETNTSFTQYIYQVMVQEGEVATNFQPSMSEAITPISTEIDSYKYLKSALENDTDIAGGLVASSQIQLRDWTGNYLTDGKTKEYKVNAGLSGINDDNILLWGGGTYEEACYAASTNNDFHVGENKSGRQITSLLKKDGQGKIGVLHIKDDRVQVNTPDGLIVIDDTDGLSCKISSQKNSAVIVTPQELKTFEQLKSLGESINKTDEYTNPFDNYLTYTIHESYGTKYAYSNDHEYQVFVGTNGTIEISGYTSPMTYEISDGRYQKYITVGNQSTDGIYCRIYNSNGEMVKSGLASTIERTTVNYTAPTADTYTVILSAQITVEFELENVSKEDLERGIIVNITLNEDLTFFKINTNYQNAEQQTMVAYKGIFSYQGDNAYFYYKDGVGFDCKIKNVRFKITDKGILIDGLPNKSDNLEKGMLYNNNGTLMIV